MTTKQFEGWPAESTLLEVAEGETLEFSILVENKTSKPAQFKAFVSGDLQNEFTIEPAIVNLGLGVSRRILVRITPPPGLHEAVLEVFRGNAHYEGGEPRSITIRCKAAAPAQDDPPVLPTAGGSADGGEGTLGGGTPNPPIPDNPPVNPPSTTGSDAIGTGASGQSAGNFPSTPLTPGSEPVLPQTGVQPGESGSPGSSPSSTISNQTVGGGKPTGTSQSGSIGMSSAPKQPTQTTGGSQGTSGESKPVGVDPRKREQEELLRKAAEEKARREAQWHRAEQFEADVTVNDPPRDGGSVTLKPGQKAKVLIPVSFDLEEAPSKNATREFGLTVTNPLALLNHEAVKVEWGSESIPAGESALLFFILNVPTNTPQGRYEFVISVTAGQRSSEDRHMTLVVEPVAAVQVAAEKKETLQRFLPPRSCTFDLTVHNHPLGNSPTAYRLAVKRPEDNAAAKIPYDDADLYETSDWEILFDDELNDVRREDNSTKLVGNYHKLTVKRKGIWWFGFQETLPLKVEAIPVTEPGNSSLPGSSLNLLLTRQRLIPISSWLAVPLITLLLFLLTMASSSPELIVKNGFNPPGSDIYYVFADKMQEKQEQEIWAKFEVKNRGWFRPRIERIIPGGSQPTSRALEDRVVLQRDTYDTEASYEVRPMFGQSSKKKVVFMGYRTTNLFSFDPPPSDRQPSELQNKQVEAFLDGEIVVSTDKATGLAIEERTLDFDKLAEYPRQNGMETKVFRLYNLATSKTAYKITVAYHLDQRYELGQVDISGQKRFVLADQTVVNSGEQVVITDKNPKSTQNGVLWLMTTDAHTNGDPMSPDEQNGIRIYRITITRGGGQ